MNQHHKKTQTLTTRIYGRQGRHFCASLYRKRRKESERLPQPRAIRSISARQQVNAKSFCLFMISLPSTDPLGAVELFEQEYAHQTVGEGEVGEGQPVVGAP